MYINIIYLLSLIVQIALVRSATITLDVFYPEAEVTPSSEGIVFVYGYSTSPYTYPLYEWQQANNPSTPFAPWFGNYTYLITQDHKSGQNHWNKTIDIGSESFECNVVYIQIQ
jgi:hypothetical protein